MDEIEYLMLVTQYMHTYAFQIKHLVKKKIYKYAYVYISDWTGDQEPNFWPSKFDTRGH